MTSLPTEAPEIYGAPEDWTPDSPKWVPASHPAFTAGVRYAIAIHGYPSGHQRKCVMPDCTFVGELLYCIGSLAYSGCERNGTTASHWTMRGDICDPCARKLIGLDRLSPVADSQARDAACAARVAIAAARTRQLELFDGPRIQSAARTSVRMYARPRRS